MKILIGKFYNDNYVNYLSLMDFNTDVVPCILGDPRVNYLTLIWYLSQKKLTR